MFQAASKLNMKLLTDSSKDDNTIWKPCDFSLWGEGLGRYPKFSVEGKRITLLPFVEEHHLGYSEKDKQKVITSKKMGDEIFDRISACYRTAIIRQIRKGFEVDIKEEKPKQSSDWMQGTRRLIKPVVEQLSKRLQIERMRMRNLWHTVFGFWNRLLTPTVHLEANVN